MHCFLCLSTLFVYLIHCVIAQNAEDYRITSLPGIDIRDLNFTQYSGHIELNHATNSNIFFWMLEREARAEGPKKLIIWLNGGPGCSSMDGLFLETGPYRVNKNLSLSINENGWQKHATIVYVDQPVGTGFSFADNDSLMHNMTQVTDGFILFLDKFFNIFPDLKQHEFYIAGESFAGVYIPYFTAKILEINREKDKIYQLKGILIGNGWISPEHQYDSMYDFAEKMDLVNASHLLEMSKKAQTCKKELKKKETIHVSSCEQLTEFVINNSINYNQQGEKLCINMYDIRLTHEPYPDCGLTWPHMLEDVTKYLQLNDVKSAIHAEKQQLGWKECTSLVSKALRNDQSQPPYYLLPNILKEVPVLLYSGEKDLICNSLGTQYLIGNMTWGGLKGYSKNIKQQEWIINEREAGYYLEERNLTFVLIKDGSHMVPYDRPVECLDMMTRFIKVSDSEINGRRSRLEKKERPQQPLQKEAEMIATSSEKHWGVITAVLVVVFVITTGGCWYHISSLNIKNRLFSLFQGRYQDDSQSIAMDTLMLEQPNFFETLASSDSESELDCQESSQLCKDQERTH